MHEEHPYYARVLHDEFQRRQERNPRHSMRAFARFLGIHPSALSRILSGKKDLAPGTALAIATKLSLNATKKRHFLKSVVDHRKLVEQNKIGIASGIPELRPQLTEISPDEFASVYNLEAHAVLQLTLTQGFQSRPAYIAERLGLSRERVEEILGALENFGLIRRVDGQILNAQADFTSVDEAHTAQIRRQLQLDIIARAARSVREDEFEKRANYSVTTSTDPTKLVEAREMILKFVESLTDFLEQGERKEVYQLNFNLFPLSRPTKDDAG